MTKRIAIIAVVTAAALIAHLPVWPTPRALGIEQPAAAASFVDFARRARAGESLEVVFFGASLTWGANASDPLRTSYRAEVARRLEREYPQARFRFHDAAIGGTGSQLGVFRLDRDVLARKPDLLFLDFSANDDITSDTPETLASYEAILRRLVAEARVPVVQVIFPFKWNVAAKSTAGMKRRDAHLALAAAYGTAVGDAISLAIDRVGRGETTLETLWPVDGVHPCDEGYQLFADAAWDAFQAAVQGGKVCRPPAALLHADTYMRAVRQPLFESAPLPAGWQVGRPNLTSAFFDFLMSRWLDDVVIASRAEAKPAEEPPPQPARLRAHFTGRMVMLLGETTKTSGKYRVWIDGKPIEHESPWTKEKTDLFDAGAFAERIGGNGHHAQVIATGLDGAAEHLLEIEPVLEPGQELRLESLCVAGPDAAVTLAWAAGPSPHAVNTQVQGDEPTAAAELVRGITVPEGFRVELFAAEPDVSQPIAITTDARGRLWVVENYSYPEWRTTGTDRVVILEDADGDGRFDSRKVFLDGGRNLTGITLGHGGVWLLSPPELVFVPDRNRDDMPDGPAEPILDGFNAKTIGHNVVNGLLWGPDGWLYGRHGITATSRVGRPGDPDSARTTIDCSIWRVHPETRRFEVVARGTTNPWGLDYDDYGEMIFTNNVIGHLWHLVPGAHYERMRGVDPEPHVYELMPQSADHLHWAGGAWQDSREKEGNVDPAADDLGGGHSHCGGMIYLGEMFPESYRGKIFMCNTHGKRVNVDRLEYGPRGIVGRHDPDFLKAFDTWFRGIELVSGPDGRVWIADWTDKGECHDHDGVHRTSGRIYTVLYGGPRPHETVDLNTKSDAELVALQLHRNDWFCRHAREILAERAAAGRDLSAAAVDLRRLAETHADPTRRLRGLWAAHAIGAADRRWLRGRLADEHASVRAWAVRLLVDDPTGEAVATAAPDWLGNALAQLAKHEPAGIVRLHLAGALGKLPSRIRWPIAESLADGASDADWRELALMLWYGLRGPVAEDPARAAALAAKTPMPTLRRLIARRLAFDADRSAACAAALESLLSATRGDVERRADVTSGIAAAWEGRKRLPLPASLLVIVAADPSLKRFAGPRVEPEVKPQDAAAASTAAEIARLQAAGPSTPAARQAAITAWRQKLTPDELSRADLSAGRAVWRQRCGACHVLFDEGGNVWPNLTGSGRAEADYAILNVMDPSAVVPEAWRLTQVITAEGRVLSGAVVAADDRTLTLRTMSGDVQLDREEIDELVTREQSVMPEGLWNGLTDEQVRNLVAYLASPTQVPLPASE